jgi:hypothetical protein
VSGFGLASTFGRLLLALLLSFLAGRLFACLFCETVVIVACVVISAGDIGICQMQSFEVAMVFCELFVIEQISKI